MKKLNNTEIELKKSVLIKKCVYSEKKRYYKKSMYILPCKKTKNTFILSS